MDRSGLVDRSRQGPATASAWRLHSDMTRGSFLLLLAYEVYTKSNIGGDHVESNNIASDLRFDIIHHWLDSYQSAVFVPL